MKKIKNYGDKIEIGRKSGHFCALRISPAHKRSIKKEIQTNLNLGFVDFSETKEFIDVYFLTNFKLEENFKSKYKSADIEFLCNGEIDNPEAIEKVIERKTIEIKKKREMNKFFDTCQSFVFVPGIIMDIEDKNFNGHENYEYYESVYQDFKRIYNKELLVAQYAFEQWLKQNKAPVKNSKIKELIDLVNSGGSLKDKDKQAEAEHVSKNEFNERIQAKKIQKDHQFHKYNDRIYKYKDGVYTQLNDSQVRNIIGDEIEAYNVKFASNGRITSVFLLLKDLMNEIEEENQYYVNLLNGNYDIKKNIMTDHTPDVISLSQLPIFYDEDAECPKWKSFLNTAFDKDQETYNALQMYFGYCLLPECSQQKMLWLYGVGASGKSTIAEVLRALIGENNSTTTDLDTMTSDFGLQNAVNKKLIWLEEVDVNRFKTGTESFLKRVIGNSPLSINQKRKDFLDTRLNSKFVATANKLPLINDTSGGLMRRLIPILFRRRIKSEDPNFLDKLIRDEISGIFNWALKGAQLFLKSGILIIPESSRKIMEEHKEDSNELLALFKEEFQMPNAFNELKGHKLIIGEGGEIEVNVFYNAYKNFRLQEGITFEMNKRKFLKTVREMFWEKEVESRKANSKYYITNIKLIQTELTETDSRHSKNTQTDVFNEVKYSDETKNSDERV
jgi:P4 family phage/plasmid primase-like protien